MSRGSRARRLHYFRSIARKTKRGARNMATIEIVRNIVVPRDRNQGKRLPTGLELARSVAKHSRVPMTKHEIHVLGRQLDALIQRASTLRSP